MEIAVFIICMVVSLYLGFRLGGASTAMENRAKMEAIVECIMLNYNITTAEMSDLIEHNLRHITLRSEELLRLQAGLPEKPKE
jgi:hypothetical protein